MTPGIHLLHKPPGPTSFSLVRTAMQSSTQSPGRRRAIIHGGTLDPFASGLLLLLVEPAHLLFDYLHDIPKTYDATLRWGIETDNGDPLGKVTSTADAAHLTPDLLDQSLPPFLGWHEQIPPATSNKRIAGERAYIRAHRGEDVVMPPSRVYLHQATWLSHNLPTESHLRLVVRGGYYIRAFARDLARCLNTRAHLSSLRRTAIGPYLDPPPDHPTPVTGSNLLPWLPSRHLSDQEVGDLRQNNPIPTGELLPPTWLPPVGFPTPHPLIRGFHLTRFTFLLEQRQENLHPLRHFRGGL